MNPQAPHTNYMNCIGCGTLLSHPPSSLTIQCPKCLVIMELPMRMNMFSQQGFSGGGGGGGGGGSGGGSRKSRKKRKDPNAPKRASNAYMIFCKERRAKLKEEHPELPFGKLGAKLGEMWRVMTADEKKPYETRASNDRDRYKKEMNSYQGATGIGPKAAVPPVGMGVGVPGVPGVVSGAPVSDEKDDNNPTKKQKIDNVPVPSPMQPQMQMPMIPNMFTLTTEQQQQFLASNPLAHHQMLVQQQMVRQQQQALAEQQQRAMALQQATFQQQQHQQQQQQLPPTEEFEDAGDEEDGDDFDEEINE